MENTVFLSQLLGLFFAITGVSMLLSRSIMTGVLKSFFGDRAFTYVFGILILIASLSLIIKHNIWEGVPAVVISALGWIMLIDSIGYLFLPQSAMKILLSWVENKKYYYIHSIVHIVLGGYLIYAGFIS